MPKILTNVREGILLVGRDLLAESGYDGFSVRAVAGRCGIGVGTLYNYFPSKQQLVAAILRAEWEIHLRRMTQLAKSKDDLRSRLVAIYGELWLFLQGLHSVWADGSAGTMDAVEFAGIQEQRALVRRQLVDIVGSALEQDHPDRIWLADGISRLYLSYAAETKRDDNSIFRLLERLLG